MDNEDILGNIIGKIYLGTIDNELERGIHRPCYILLVQMKCGLVKRTVIFGNTFHGGLQIHTILTHWFLLMLQKYTNLI